MKILERTDFCIVPWINYTLTTETLSTCCWDASAFCFSFGQYKGPWQGDFWLSNPKLLSQRERMMIKGSKSCPDVCPFKNKLKTVKEQVNKFIVDEKSFNYCTELIQKIEAKIIDTKMFPLVLGVTPSLRCNQECAFCIMNRERDLLLKSEPTEKEIENLFPLYTNCVDFETCGGDTFGLSDEKIEKYYSPMRGKKATVRVITNGRGLTLERYEKFFINGPLNHITLSISSLNPERYHILHGRPIEPVIKNLTDITTKYPKHYFKNVSIVLCSNNIDDVTELIKFVINLGIRDIYLRRVIPSRLPSRGFEYLDLFGSSFNEELCNRFDKMRREIFEISKNYQINVNGLENLCNEVNKKLEDKRKTNEQR